MEKLLDPNLEPSQIWEIKVQINKIAIKQAEDKLHDRKENDEYISIR